MSWFVIARKRSLRRLCFYTCLSVILFTGGEYLGRVPGTPPWAPPPPRTRCSLGRYIPQDHVHPPGRYPHRTSTSPGQVPPGARYTPLRPSTPSRTRHTPQGQVHPPGTRYTTPGPGTPPGTRYIPQDQAHTPWDQVHPPSSACWEIRATSGWYPTGIHSCLWNELAAVAVGGCLLRGAVCPSACRDTHPM